MTALRRQTSLVTPIALLLALAFLAAACTSANESGDGSTTTDGESTATTLDAMADVVDVCRTEMLKQEPDVVRLAIDPAITGFALNLPPEAVPETAAGLYECLGDEFTPAYLVADTIVAGQQLPSDAVECFAPAVAENGAGLVEVSLRRARFEVPEEEAGQAFVELLTECVPGRFLAAPLQTQSETAYGLWVDEDCLDDAHQADNDPLRAMWELQVFSEGNPDPSVWTDAESVQYVAPLYECVNTGAFIATDPTLGVTVSRPTRTCISGVAEDAGYWESKVALREFDTESYERAIADCLTPEEALQVLGVPIPTDDPIESNFLAVSDCFDSLSPSDVLTGFEELADAEDLQAALAQASESDDPAGAVNALSVVLSDCAGPEGVAGSYAGLDFGTPVPEGTYDCLLPLAEADADNMLEGQLQIEAGLATTDATGTAYAEALSQCLPAGYYANSLFAVFSSPSFAETIDRQCITEALPDGSEASDAFWAEFLDRLGSDSEPNDRAALAVDGLYECVDPGGGFADAAKQAGTDLSDATVECIDDSVRQLQPLEWALVGAPIPSEALSQTIADCLSEEEVEQLRGG